MFSNVEGYHQLLGRISFSNVKGYFDAMLRMHSDIKENHFGTRGGIRNVEITKLNQSPLGFEPYRIWHQEQLKQPVRKC